MENILADFNQRLEETRQQQRRQEKLRRHLASAEADLEQARARLAGLESALRKEGRDVEKLEGLSLASLFYLVLGSQEEQLEKERQERLVAKLKCDQARFSVESLSREVESLFGELAGLGDVETRYQSILNEKEKWLIERQDENSPRLMGLQEQILDAQSEMREVAEALQAGRAALKGLEEMLSSLQSAGNWGAWDLLGGGLLATAAKHSRIDDARDTAHYVQEALRRFNRELTDLGGLDRAFVEVDSFETFADYFFDNLIVDWVVQSKIERSLSGTEALHRRVSEMVGYLDGKQASLQESIRNLKTDRQRLVEAAR